MLVIHHEDDAQPLTWQTGNAIPDDAIWFDLCNADAAERKAVEQTLGLALPRREDIRGIGLAGRNRSAGDTLFLHVSRFADAEDEHKHATPLSLVLTPKVLVTQRYARSQTFDNAAQQLRDSPQGDGASAAFACLIETMAERTAGSMQKIAGDVAELSDEVFSDHRDSSRQLRRWLLHVGQLEGRLARSRASLLGITRIVSFVCDKRPEWMPAAQQSRLATVRNDLVTLDEFDQQLTDKLQFLLDAIFGFISVNQNSVMKLFTVASVVAVPPVLLAGIWGMNFRHMPELSWTWGYAFALGTIALSILIPLAIFKWRGWLTRD